MDVKERKKISHPALWMIAGPFACVAIALACNHIAFAGLAPEARQRAYWAATLVPGLLGGPFFLFMACRLRELETINRKLGIIAETDGLTNCLTRSAFLLRVEARLRAPLPSGGAMHGALLIIDADHFKVINDRYGHATGDAALVLMAQAIRSSIRASDSVGRLGGEEFGVFLPGVGRFGAETVAERLRRAVETLGFVAQGKRHPLTVSVGGVVFDTSTNFEKLFKAADARLYAAKHHGRNRVDILGVGQNADLANLGA